MAAFPGTNEPIHGLPPISGNIYGYGGHLEQSGSAMDNPMTSTYGGSSSEQESKLSSFLNSNPFRPRKTKEGQAPKKRGPKPDSRPAATRRQELNRQAQRTHRERKEMYTKSLEAEANRTRLEMDEKDRIIEALRQENTNLKQVLAVSGIDPNLMADHHRNHVAVSSPTHSQLHTIGHTSQLGNLQPGNEHLTGQASVNSPGQYTTASSHGYSSPSASHHASVSPPPASALSQATMPFRQSPVANGSGNHTSPANSTAMSVNNIQPESFLGVGGTLMGPDGRVPPSNPVLGPVDQLAVDFILALESNCHEHEQNVCDMVAQDPEAIHGHALMLSWNPRNTMPGESPNDQPIHHPNPSRQTLRNLVNLSQTVPAQGGELTPTLAFICILEDERYPYLTLQDFYNLTNELKSKSRCYGWGAVVERYEVVDAMDEIFPTKDDEIYEE